MQHAHDSGVTAAVRAMSASMMAALEVVAAIVVAAAMALHTLRVRRPARVQRPGGRPAGRGRASGCLSAPSDIIQLRAALKSLSIVPAMCFVMCLLRWINATNGGMCRPPRVAEKKTDLQAPRPMQHAHDSGATAAVRAMSASMMATVEVIAAIVVAAAMPLQHSEGQTFQPRPTSRWTSGRTRARIRGPLPGR